MTDKELKATFSKNLNYYLSLKNKTQKEVAEAINVLASTFNTWCTGSAMPRMGKIQSLADYFGIGKSDLLEPRSSAPTSYKTVMIPLLSSVSCGSGCLAEENIEGYVDFPESLSKTGDFFALTVKGDSMEPDLHNGDIVIVRSQPDAESGELVIAKVDGDEGFCKRLQKYENGTIALVSNNPAYPPKYFSGKEVAEKPVTIVGKVVELRRHF